MTTLYLICFGTGLGLTLLSVLGGGHLHFHAASHHALPHAHHGQASWINGFTLPAFLSWLGGTGYLLARFSGLTFSLILLLSALSGLTGAAIIFFFLARILLPHDRELLLEDTAMQGVLAELTAPLPHAASVGEIQFTQQGARRFAPARSATGAPLRRGQQVIVLNYQNGVASVTPFVSPLQDEPEP